VAIYLLSPALIIVGLYGFLLGLGRAPGPAVLRGNDIVTVVGRVVLFLGILALPTCFGYSLADIQDWLEDIWTSGGGKGTG